MAKILKIKLDKEGLVDIRSFVPEGMTEDAVNELLTTALPMAVAALATARSEGSLLAARADILTMFEKADALLSEMVESREEDCDGCACCCEGDDHPDDQC